jgi:hypothetical protein
MPTVTTCDHPDGVRVLILTRPPANAIDETPSPTRPPPSTRPESRRNPQGSS